MNLLPTHLDTRGGPVHFPAYIPVTTFGDKHPLDALIRPYLPRMAPALMVSLHYAKQMTDRPALPLMIDSGGFASLFEGATIVSDGDIGLLETRTGDDIERLHPLDVLEFQEQHADVAFTLDFIIPPDMEPKEAGRRLDLTVANALWALRNRRRRDMPLYACIQAWDVSSARRCARAYAGEGFDGVAIGGLVPRARDEEEVLRVVDAVREEVPDKPLHVFGLGAPRLVRKLFEHGVQSVDSSSYVRLAAAGRLWTSPDVALGDISPAERMQIALCNLAFATQQTLPLAASSLVFSTHGLLRRIQGTRPSA